MIRKQIYIEKRQQEVIRKLAASQGVSEAEVIRQAVDAQRVQGSSHLHLDTSAWERAFKIMRSTQADKEGGKSVRPKRWNRDALYEDRLNRYGRRSR